MCWTRSFLVDLEAIRSSTFCLESLGERKSFSFSLSIGEGNVLSDYPIKMDVQVVPSRESTLFLQSFFPVRVSGALPVRLSGVCGHSVLSHRPLTASSDGLGVQHVRTSCPYTLSGPSGRAACPCATARIPDGHTIHPKCPCCVSVQNGHAE